MEDLVEKLVRLKDSEIGSRVDSRISEFEKIGRGTPKELFGELCFCLLTANFNAGRSIKIQNALGTGFLTLSEDELATQLETLGHRFPNARAKYIVEARKHFEVLQTELDQRLEGHCAREWLVLNVKGLGYKEASHFLRNIGRKDVAIIDFHILDLLARYGLVEPQKTRCLTKNRYIGIEKILGKLAQKANLNLAELDLYLWYIETGTILK